MSLLVDVAREIKNSKVVQSRIERWETDYTYRENIKANVAGVATFIGIAGVVGALIYLAGPTDDDSLSVDDLVEPSEGLRVSPEVLEQLIGSGEAQYFETDQGIFTVKYFSEIFEYAR